MVINYNQLLLLWMIIIQFGDNYGNYQLLFFRSIGSRPHRVSWVFEDLLHWDVFQSRVGIKLPFWTL